MKMQKNEFETICNSLEREYLPEDGNRFRYAKDYLKKYSGNNYDRLKSIHAEAMDKIGDTYDKYLSMFSLIVSVLSFIVAALALIITIVHEKGLLIVVAIIVYLFFLLIISVLFMKFINASRSVSHWQKYVVEAVEDILDDMKNEKDNRKEVHLPDNLYEKLDNLETKVDLPDRLYNQLDSIEKASSENPLKKIISKK